MRKFLIILAIFFISFSSLYAGEEIFDFNNKFNPYASVYNSLSALENPAIFGFLKDNQFSLFYQESFSLDSKNYGSVIEVGNIGLCINYSDNNIVDFIRYSIPVGFRSGDHMLIGFGVSLFDPVLPRYNIAWDWYAGAYFMPTRFINISLVGQNLGQPAVGDIPLRRRINLGLGLKPFSEYLELYGDFSFIEHNTEMPNRYFIALNPTKGVKLFYGINEEKDMYGGINLDLSKIGFAFQGSYSDSRGIYNGKGFAIRYSKNDYEELLTISKQIVVIRLDGSIVDGSNEDFLGLRKKGRSLIDILNVMKSIAYDNSVAGIYLYVSSDINISLGAAGEIKSAISLIKSNGKKVVSFIESGDDITYYIANSADKIILNEGGSLIIKGSASKGLYFKNFFEKIGLRFDVVAAGEYKTAFEPLVSEQASEKRRQQINNLLLSIQKVLDESIKTSRGIDNRQLEKIYSIGIFSPKRAREERLIDDISTSMQLNKDVKLHFGKEYNVNHNYYNTSLFKGIWQIKRKIAVIYLNGDIVYGKGFGDSIGFESIGNFDITEIVDDIIKDESITGVIVRINSPGGSTMASQLIFEELKRLGSIKPLVVSVGSMAASGGYFSAIASDLIIADELSIVGSVGVFFLKPDISDLLKKIGVNYDPQTTKDVGDSDSIFRGLKEGEKRSIKEYIDDFYIHFKEKVSMSRKIDISKINELAEGKVFVGYDARSLGLIDEVGGYFLAEKRIRDLAKIPSDVDVEFIGYGKKNELKEVIMGDESFINRIVSYFIKDKRITDFVLYRYIDY